MKTFYVLCTYMANYTRLIPVRARTADEACSGFREMYGAKGTVYVLDAAPAIIHYKMQTFTRDESDTRAHVDDYRDASQKNG